MANYINNQIISACNVPPVANADTASVAFNSTTGVIIPVIAGTGASSTDTDAQGNNTINNASILLDRTASGAATGATTLTVAGEGTYTANANGTVTFEIGRAHV